MDVSGLTLSVASGIALLSFLPFMDQYIKLCPALFGSLLQTSTAIRTEDKCKLSRSRNMIFALSILPLSILVWHNGLLRPGWMSSLEAPWDFLATTGFLMGYFLLRLLLRVVLPVPKLKNKVYAAWCGLPRTFVPVLLTIVAPLSILMQAAGVPEDSSRIVLFSLIGICYFIFLIRRFHIFASEGNFLQAILYLCTLEILPTAVAVGTIVVF